MVLGLLGYPHGKKIKQDACKIPYTKTNVKKIRDLNIKEKTLKLLEENIGRFLKDLIILKGFLKWHEDKP